LAKITVFTANRVRTMNPSAPIATAVAVRDGRILEVGTLDSMKPWLDAFPHEINDAFRNDVMLPGLIDPHLHPSLGAVLLQSHFITAMEWQLPDGETAEPVHGQDDYLRRLQVIHQSLETGEPLLSWGYHKIWHGDLNRSILDQVSSERPIIIWQRSYHEMFVNSAALRWLEVDETEADRHPQVDIANGRFFEVGKSVLMSKFAPYLLEPSRYKAGLEKVKQVIHQGGHTTVGDMGMGIFNLDLEWETIKQVLDTDDTPFRVCIMGKVIVSNTDVEAEVEKIAGLPSLNTHRLLFGDRIKLFADGGYYAELMQVLPPGFIDGHEGEWMTSPEQLEALARAAWHRGMKIHIHCTGDLGVELALDILEKLQWERPRFDHRFTIEHFGLSTPEQCQRIAALGAQVSANAYYVHELADAYWHHSIGHERSSQMSRLGTLADLGVRTALHSDYTMAPAEPLNSVWVAVNRLSTTGEVMAEDECLTIDQAMRAVTIDAAYVLGLENEVGSIRAGKRADFTIVGQDPYETPSVELKDIPVLATVFEGDVHRINK
jgi:predicted amidohydrolase YtcJ